MNFFELDISYFQRANQFTLQEILFLGAFHGTVFSLPFSAPLLICFRRFLLDGIKIGTIALFGTLFGQFTFLLFIFLGFRPLIQCWYIFEPFLAFLGMSLALKLATDFFHQKNFGFEEFRGGLRSNTESFSSFPFFKILNPLFSALRLGDSGISTSTKIFCFQFLLMFLNPAFPATSTRLILGQDLLDGLPLTNVFANTNSEIPSQVLAMSSSISGLSFGICYALGFILGSLVFVLCFVFALQFIFSQLQNFQGLPFSLSSGTASKTGSRERTAFSGFQFANQVNLNKAFVFLIIGCLLQGTIQYSWRLFTQYPMEFIGWNSTATTKMDTDGEKIGVGRPEVSSSIQREFPSFDSNIRHRDKNLPVERHIPVEKVNSRRILSGKPPLNEEQKSDAYLKYNSFFLNKIEHSIEDSKIRFRTPDSHLRTYEEISQLQKMKERYLKAQAIFSGYKTSTNSKARSLENTTKGKPKLSYIRELLDKRGGNSQVSNVSSNTQSTSGSRLDSLYIHDDIQIYNALFKMVSS
jgi:hypothetical protein